MRPIRLVAVGDPVMDVLAHVPSLPPGTEPGGCLPVSAPEMDALLAALPVPPARAPGGSAANVARGAAQVLGGGGGGQGGSGDGRRGCEATFHGMVGDDATGCAYGSALAGTGVTPALLVARSGGGGGEGGTSPATTAVCACLVTPDGQRTMRTCLGAATGLTDAALLPPGWADGADVVHVEGYALWRPGLAPGLFAAARAARRRGGGGCVSGGENAGRSLPPPPLTSLDCASFEVVRARASDLRALLEAGAVDVLFANEEEAAALGRAWGGGEEGGAAASASAASASAAAAAAASGDSLDLEAAALAGQRLAAAHTAVAAVVSLGPRGARALWWEGGALRCDTAPARAVAVKDTVGAGDAFAGGFLAALACGVGVHGALVAGCGCGAAAVEVDGADAGAAAMAAVGRAALERNGGEETAALERNGGEETAAV